MAETFLYVSYGPPSPIQVGAEWCYKGRDDNGEPVWVYINDKDEVRTEPREVKEEKDSGA